MLTTRIHPLPIPPSHPADMVLPSMELTPNIGLRGAIVEWLEARGLSHDDADALLEGGGEEEEARREGQGQGHSAGRHSSGGGPAGPHAHPSGAAGAGAQVLARAQLAQADDVADAAAAVPGWRVLSPPPAPAGSAGPFSPTSAALHAPPQPPWPQWLHGELDVNAPLAAVTQWPPYSPTMRRPAAIPDWEDSSDDDDNDLISLLSSSLTPERPVPFSVRLRLAAASMARGAARGPLEDEEEASEGFQHDDEDDSEDGDDDDGIILPLYSDRYSELGSVPEEDQLTTMQPLLAEGEGEAQPLLPHPAPADPAADPRATDHAGTAASVTSGAAGVPPAAVREVAPDLWVNAPRPMGREPSFSYPLLSEEEEEEVEAELAGVLRAYERARAAYEEAMDVARRHRLEGTEVLRARMRVSPRATTPSPPQRWPALLVSRTLQATHNRKTWRKELLLFCLLGTKGSEHKRTPAPGLGCCCFRCCWRRRCWSRCGPSDGPPACSGALTVRWGCRADGMPWPQPVCMCAAFPFMPISSLCFILYIMLPPYMCTPSPPLQLHACSCARPQH